MEQENTAPEGAAVEPRSFSDILRGEPTPRPEEPAGRPEPEAAPVEQAATGDKPDAKPERPRDDAGRFAPKAEAPDTGPPPEPKQDGASQTVPLSAVLEERKKRQAIEQRLKELEARLAQPAPPPQPVAPPQPEVPLEDLMFQDPQRFIQAVRAPLEEQLLQTRWHLSEQVHGQQPDYNEAYAALLDLKNRDPAAAAVIDRAMRTHPDPGGWVLQQGRALLRQQKWGEVIQQYGSPDDFIAARQPAPPPANPLPPAPPASLAAARSAATRAAPVAPGQRSISEILGRRR
jgi:hypothetical protein